MHRKAVVNLCISRCHKFANILSFPLPAMRDFLPSGWPMPRDLRDGTRSLIYADYGVAHQSSVSVCRSWGAQWSTGFRRNQEALGVRGSGRDGTFRILWR